MKYLKSKEISFSFNSTSTSGLPTSKMKAIICIMFYSQFRFITETCDIAIKGDPKAKNIKIKS